MRKVVIVSAGTRGRGGRVYNHFRFDKRDIFCRQLNNGKGCYLFPREYRGELEGL